MTIRYAARANLYHLQQFLNGQQRDSPHDTIQALDVVMRESPSLKYDTSAISSPFLFCNILFCWSCDHVATDFILFRSYVTVSRSFFSKQFGVAKDIGDGLECWRGYYQSSRPTQMGLSLNIGTNLLRN